MTELPFDPNAVDDLLRNVARQEIMPRFRNLKDGAVFEKRPGELVTEADIMAERWLAERLTSLLPGSTVVGEENSEDDPGLLLRIGSGTTWVVDPVDGTQNFADGSDCFAVIIAFCQDGETYAGWIYNPIGDIVCRAIRGAGARFDNGSAIAPPRRGTDIVRLRGSLGYRARTALKKRRSETPELVKRYRCVGREYMDLAAGVLDFVQYGFRLKPWDHLAGALIAAEAGYHVALAGTGGAYRPGPDGVVDGSIIVAPNTPAWRWIESLIA